jgi:hypothetical protein
MDDLPSQPVVRLDRCLPAALQISRLLKLFRAKVSGSRIEKSIDIVRVLVVRKPHNTGALPWPSACRR